LSIVPKCNAIWYSSLVTPRQNKAKQIDPIIFFMVYSTNLVVKIQKHYKKCLHSLSLPDIVTRKARRGQVVTGGSFRGAHR
jgi:hypothetical protein